jgi:thiol-disulfide isomerase/thioredoxin
MSTTTDLESGSALASLRAATQWVGSPPLTDTILKGRVVLVQFCTYSCINWIRTLPYVRAWAERYAESGLLVLGVHTPEFSFEKDIDKVRHALADMEVRHPIAVDNDYAIWTAFGNRYWPALYFVDAAGTTRHWHFGEGAYEDSERVIKELLAETGADGLGSDVVSVDGYGPEAAPAWHTLNSPEAYLGYQRAVNFASRGGASPDEARAYHAPTSLSLNEWALTGEWTVGPEAAVSTGADGSIEHRFHARDLHLVMGPVSGENPMRFRVLVDGQPPGDAHGSDIDANGEGVAREQRLYQLIRQTGSVVDRSFRITFLDPGVAAYSFTFG